MLLSCYSMRGIDAVCAASVTLTPQRSRGMLTATAALQRLQGLAETMLMVCATSAGAEQRGRSAWLLLTARRCNVVVGTTALDTLLLLFRL